MSDEPTLGSRLIRTGTAAEWLELEAREGRTEHFEAIDLLVAGVAIRALNGGQRVVEISSRKPRPRVGLVGIADQLRPVLAEAMQLERQESRGAWFLPESAPIDARLINLPFLLRQHPRYGHTLARDERAKVPLGGDPDAMFIWAVLQPLFEDLLAPFALRVDDAGKLSRDEFASRWREIVEIFNELNLNVGRAMAPFGWGGGWASASADEQVVFKADLLAAIANALNADSVRRFRSRTVRSLALQYYAKAKKGRAKRKQVVTKDLARVLAGFFGGDWLAFVEYLGELPHEEERVATALPAPKLVVSDRDKAAALAAQKGIPLEEVERMLAGFWEGGGNGSAVEKRVATLRGYWAEFDAIHASQKPGMPPLWGLVQDSPLDLGPIASTPYQSCLYLRRFSPSVLQGVASGWATTVLPKWPETVVTEPFPHMAVADVLGPALKFWHGCALTAWFICEGPTSRTDLPGLERYYANDLASLAESGCPINASFFHELRKTPLGREQPIMEKRGGIGGLLGIEVSVSRGTRRDGFERLRDVITRYRRAWAEEHLERYLRAQWEQLLKSTRRQFDRMAEDRGKPPTLKQFAKHTITPARRWFGGDVGLLFGMLGLKQTFTVERRSLMPQDPAAFARDVFVRLGGTMVDPNQTVETEEQLRIRNAAWDRQRKLERLASDAIPFVQAWEAIGNMPTTKEYGGSFAYNAAVLSDDLDQGWRMYVGIIEDALRHARASAEGRLA
ncbi:MAG: hypothetical protein U0414_35970 [Polyangiaceae bacterium]